MKLHCKKDREILVKYLTRALTDLYNSELYNDNEIVISAREGAIIELEMLWDNFLEETPPTKAKLIKIN